MSESRFLTHGPRLARPFVVATEYNSVTRAACTAAARCTRHRKIFRETHRRRVARARHRASGGCRNFQIPFRSSRLPLRLLTLSWRIRRSSVRRLLIENTRNSTTTECTFNPFKIRVGGEGRRGIFFFFSTTTTRNFEGDGKNKTSLILSFFIYVYVFTLKIFLFYNRLYFLIVLYD